MNTFFKKNLIAFLSLVSVSMLAQLPGAVFAQCSTSVVLTVPDTYYDEDYVGNGNFNAIVFGNLTATGGDTEGRLAVGGDFSAHTYSVGSGSQGPPALANEDNFIVNGVADTRNWGMIGNFVYNTLAGGAQVPTHPAGTGTDIGNITNRLSFNNLKAYYTTLSTELAGKTDNGDVEYGPYDYVQIKLTGSNTTLNIFTVTLPETKSFGIDIAVPAGSAVLINVTNKTVVFKNGSMTGGQREKTLFNFSKATSISTSGFAIEAQVLAPLASLSGMGGSINGQAVIGGNVLMDGGFEFHNFCSSFPMPSTTPLPVTLTSFTVGKEGTQAILKWETTWETNSDHFEIQHSTDAKQWREIGTLTSKGESKEVARYQYVHSNPVNGVNYYRLKMIDLDGTYAFSRVRDVSVNAPEAVMVYPNPVINEATIATQDWTKVKEIYLINTAGKRIAVSTASDKVDLSKISAGIYVLQVNQLNGSVSTTKIVKQ